MRAQARVSAIYGVCERAAHVGAARMVAVAGTSHVRGSTRAGESGHSDTDTRDGSRDVERSISALSSIVDAHYKSDSNRSHQRGCGPRLACATADLCDEAPPAVTKFSAQVDLRFNLSNASSHCHFEAVCSALRW